MNPYRNRKLWKAHCVAAVALTAALAGTGGTSPLPGVCLWAGEISSSQVNQEPVESSDGQIAQDGGSSPGSALIEDSGHAVIGRQRLQQLTDTLRIRHPRDLRLRHSCLGLGAFPAHAASGFALRNSAQRILIPAVHRLLKLIH